jgi:hypothetical protein
MRDRFKDTEHLFRLALVFGALFVVFLGARAILKPQGFGTYGHYRAGALDDNRARARSYAGRAACLDCHEAIEAETKSGAHAGVGCEACHGPLQSHVNDPANVVPSEPDPKSLCLTCHLENVAKPMAFPQIDPGDHAGNDDCATCHRPHTPLPIKE